MCADYNQMTYRQKVKQNKSDIHDGKLLRAIPPVIITAYTANIYDTYCDLVDQADHVIQDYELITQPTPSQQYDYQLATQQITRLHVTPDTMDSHGWMVAGMLALPVVIGACYTIYGMHLVNRGRRRMAELGQ